MTSHKLTLSNVFARLLIASAVVVLASACGGDDHDLPEIDCASVTAPGFAEVPLLTTCSACHSSALEGADRLGAPVGVDYDTFDDASANAEHGVAEVFAGSMPPGGNVAQAQKDEFYAWALCGTPQ